MEVSGLPRLSRVSRFRPLAFLILFFASCQSFDPSRDLSRFSIISAHEHIASFEEVPKLLSVMERAGIAKTVLLGSPSKTFRPELHGFHDYDQNNDLVLEISRKNPDRFIPFVTIDPEDPEKLSKLKTFLAKGAKGLKLFSGHRVFHSLPLDDPGMESIYSYCEQNKIPVIFHVNSGYYEKEFERVLDAHPTLKVLCPHFCLSSIASDRFERLMSRYPNLYTDLSFGMESYLSAALIRFSKDSEKYRKLIRQYQDRILFGTDAVLDGHLRKDSQWLGKIFKTYRSLIEETSYETFLIPGRKLNGFGLKEKTIRKIYESNFNQFISIYIKKK